MVNPRPPSGHFSGTSSGTPHDVLTGFHSILNVHDNIHASMDRHQEALVRNGLKPDGFRLAVNLFLNFDRALRSHIRAENQFLIPAFEKHCPETIGCTPEILLAEHKKLERLLDELLEFLQELQARGAPEPLQIVEILERERMIKEVLDHHGIREAEGFIPNLEKFIPDATAKKLMEQCNLEHEKADDLR